MLNLFIDNLVQLGYSVERISKSPQVFKIDESLVNVRTTTNVKNADTVPVLWYDVNYQTLNKVDYVVYIMTSPYYFLKIPSHFLLSLKDHLYPSYQKNNTGSFMVNWDSCCIECNTKVFDVIQFYQNVVDPEDFPNFKLV